MKANKKIMIAGVGGQGVVYLTRLLVEAALLADVPVATSEIHGLSQRGGSVNAGLTFGENSFGFIEKAGADFLLGLEALEAQRCVLFLHKGSKAVIDHQQILPYSVNSGLAKYPDTTAFIQYLYEHIAAVTFITEMGQEVDSIRRNLYVLGAATGMEGFPVPLECVLEAAKRTARKGTEESSQRAILLGARHGKVKTIHHE